MGSSARTFGIPHSTRGHMDRTPLAAPDILLAALAVLAAVGALGPWAVGVQVSAAQQCLCASLRPQRSLRFFPPPNEDERILVRGATRSRDEPPAFMRRHPLLAAMRDVRFEVDGETVTGALHEPEGEARGNVLLVHGLLSQRLEFGDAPQRLASMGWRVLSFDQRGFGASGGARGILTQERATDDVLAALAWLDQDKPGLPTAVLGHSMGALFALRALAMRPDVRCGVLVAPMRSPRDEVNPAEYVGYRAAHLMSTLTTRVGVGPIRVPYKYDYADLFVDPDAVKRAREDAFLHPQVDLTNVPAFLEMNAEAEARRVKQPVLVVIAKHDRAVKPANSRRVHDALAGRKELVTVDSGHSVFGDRDANNALRLVDDWLSRELVGGSKTTPSA